MLYDRFKFGKCFGSQPAVSKLAKWMGRPVRPGLGLGILAAE